MPSESLRYKQTLLTDFEQSFVFINNRIRAVDLLVQKVQPADQIFLLTTASDVFVHRDLQERHAT